MALTLEPGWLDVKVIETLAPFQRNPALVDAVETLTQTAFFNGLIYALPLFLVWHFADGERRAMAQRLVFTIMLGSVIGALGSLVLQRVVEWPPPARHPALAHNYADQYRENKTLNSFPSDSTMLYSVVAFGTATWSRRLMRFQLAWLVAVVAASKIFVGGHYPADIAAGLLLGFVSYVLSQWWVGRSAWLSAFAGNESLLLRVVLFCWLFEVGSECRDVREIVNGLWHLRKHV